MFLINWALLGVVLPALVAAITLAVTLVIGRRVGRPAGGLGVALALGAGYLAGHAGIAWPSSDVTDRIPIIALAAAILGMLEATWPGPAWVRWENRLAFSALTVALMVGPVDLETLGVRNPNVWLAALGVGIVLSWANLEALGGLMTGVALALPLVVISGGTSAVLLLSGSMVLARLGVALTAAIATSWLVSTRDTPFSIARGCTPILVLALSALILEGNVYSELATSGMVLLAAAPLMLWITRLGPIRRRALWQVGLIGAAAVLIPIALAAGTALLATPADKNY